MLSMNELRVVDRCRLCHGHSTAFFALDDALREEKEGGRDERRGILLNSTRQ